MEMSVIPIGTKIVPITQKENREYGRGLTVANETIGKTHSLIQLTIIYISVFIHRGSSESWIKKEANRKTNGETDEELSRRVKKR